MKYIYILSIITILYYEIEKENINKIYFIFYYKNSKIYESNKKWYKEKERKRNISKENL